MKRFLIDCLIVVVLGLVATLPLWAQNVGSCPCKAGGEACPCEPGVCPNCPAQPVSADVPQYRIICERGVCYRVQVGSASPPVQMPKGPAQAPALAPQVQQTSEPPLAHPRLAAILHTRPLVRLVHLVRPFHRRCR